MSAFMSMIDQGEAVLLTDGAIWHGRDKTLVGTMEKVFRPRAGPMAVTMRAGDSNIGEAMARRLCVMADEQSVAGLLDNLQDTASDLHRRFGPSRSNADKFEIFLTALLPDGRGVHCGFLNCPQGRSNSDDYVGAYRVWHPPGDRYRGAPEIEDSDIEAAGLSRQPGEALSGYARRCGADIFELMRRKPGPDFDGVEQFWVGGHVDLTVIRPAGCTTERLRTWPDEVGQLVNPLNKINRSFRDGQRSRLEYPVRTFTV